jgi:hypothetical protein
VADAGGAGDEGGKEFFEKTHGRKKKRKRWREFLPRMTRRDADG